MNGHDNRVVIVTGASRGLGRAVAVRFGSAGCRVAVNYLQREADAHAAVEEVRRRGCDAAAFRADVRKSYEVDAMVRGVTERWGAVQVLVNNAGIARDRLAVRMTEDDWDSVLDTDLKGPVLCMQAVSRVMMRQREGQIVSIGSLSGMQGREGQANYAAAKAGLIGVTRTAARELGRFNISVNAVLPGYLPTDLGGTVSAGIRDRIRREQVLGRPSDPDEVAEFIYRLTCMRNVSGQVFNLDSRIL